MIPMDNAMKKAIVDKHNELRNKIASGEIEHYKQAARMATMQWDDELEEKARMNVYQCNMMHDNCGSKISKKSFVFIHLAKYQLMKRFSREF